MHSCVWQEGAELGDAVLGFFVFFLIEVAELIATNFSCNTTAGPEKAID